MGNKYVNNWFLFGDVFVLKIKIQILTPGQLIVFIIFSQSQYLVKSRSPRSSPAATYFRDWNRYLSPRSDGYNDVDEPKIDIGVILKLF